MNDDASVTKTDNLVKRQTEQELRAYRVSRYDEMRFTGKEAQALADATDHTGFPVDWHKVKKAVDGGCGHKLAIRIFT
jgi:hypothetical protein